MPHPKPATAVLISGHMRSFRKCYDSQYWHVYRKLLNPHFFVSVEEDADYSSVELLKKFYGENCHVETVTQPEIPVLPEYERNSLFAPYGISVPIPNILKMFWSRNRAWEFFLNSAQPDYDYTAFVHIRPDLFIHHMSRPFYLRPGTVYTPWHDSYGGLNDRVAIITGLPAATAYFTLFQRLERTVKNGCPFHPESLLAGSLELDRVHVSQTLPCEHTTIRRDGDPRMDAPPVYYASDIFKYAEALAAESRLVALAQTSAHPSVPAPRR